jgi:hypothetical protein
MMYRTSTVVHVCSLRSNVDTCRLPDCLTRTDACCRTIHIVVAINDDKCTLFTVVAEADADDGADVPPAAPARVP